MNKKLISTGLLGIFVGSAFPSLVFSQSMTPDCYGTLEAWKADSSLRNYMATHNCYCPSPNSRPVCTPKSSPTPRTPSGLSPSQQMQLQMFQAILQPFFSSLFDFSSLFAPPDTSYEDALRKQQEEAKRKALEAWNKHLKDAQEQARMEAESRQRAGQDILSQVRIGSGSFGSYTIIGPRASERETIYG